VNLSGSDQLTVALREARLAEAAQLDAMLSLQDAKVLRLSALQSGLLPRLAGHPEVKSLFELNIQHGPNPRLWIDLISSVVMEPDPQTFRLVQDQNGARETLHETRDLNNMVAFVTKVLAHRMVAHDKVAATVKPPTHLMRDGYSFWEMAYVWFTGCVFGVFALLIAAILLGKLHF
jgi:hypothetical protein